MQNPFFWLMLALLFVVTAITISKGKKTQKKRPGQFLLFEAMGKTAAECRSILKQNTNNTIFSYTLENAKSGGQYITFTEHLPTEQTLETVYLLCFEQESPAQISMSFVREIFGAKEPVFAEALLDDFFKEKLNAVRVTENA